MRGGKDITTPIEAIFAPNVIITNEMAGSGGDALQWMFRNTGIGPPVGKRTGGRLLGHHTSPADLPDGGFTGTPNLTFYNPNEAWGAENHGVSPDIEVEYDPKALRTGHDPELEKDVEAVMELLKKDPPPPTPQHPPYPNYQKSPAHQPTLIWLTRACCITTLAVETVERRTRPKRALTAARSLLVPTLGRGTGNP